MVSGSLRDFWFVAPPSGRGTRAWTAELTQIWRRLHSPRSESWLGLGLALDGNSGASHPLPAGELGHQVASGGEIVGLRLAGRYGPFIDPVTGRTYDRIEASASARWALARRWSLTSDLVGGRVRGGPQDGESLVGAELRATWSATRDLDLSWGLRGRLQEPSASDRVAPALHQWTVFASLVYAARGPL